MGKFDMDGANMQRLHMPSLLVKRLGLEAAREAAQKKVLDVKFEPKGNTDVSSPKFGKEDPNNQPHTGGNTWAGGVSGVSILLPSGDPVDRGLDR